MEPESISAETWREESEISGEVRETQRELGSEIVDALSRTTSEKAQKGSMQSSAVQRAGDCSVFFQIRGFFGFFAFGFRGG